MATLMERGMKLRIVLRLWKTVTDADDKMLQAQTEKRCRP
jgi:hypothetical protein